MTDEHDPTKDPAADDPTAELRWMAFADAIGDAATGLRAGDEQGAHAALAAASQAARRITPADQAHFVNTMHVPEDAGEWEPAIRRLLARIPDGWGRWLSLGAGWYPIVCELDAAIAERVPDYTVEQVKEKFGGLRFYYSLPREEITDPADPAPPGPGPGAPAEEVAAWDAAIEAWSARQDVYMETPEGRAREAAAQALEEEIEALVRAAEETAARTCESCGAPGTMHRSRSSWYRTLCPDCAGEDYREVPPRGE